MAHLARFWQIFPRFEFRPARAVRFGGAELLPIFLARSLHTGRGGKRNNSVVVRVAGGGAND